MKAAGKFYGADRAYVLEADQDLRILVNTYEWCADGISHEQEHLQYIPFERAPHWEHAMHENQPFIVPDVEELKEYDEAEYFMLQIQFLMERSEYKAARRRHGQSDPRGLLSLFGKQVRDNAHEYNETSSRPLKDWRGTLQCTENDMVEL